MSKFSRVSIFSDLNHLRDITLSRHYSDIVGHSAVEIERNYAEYLEKLAADLETSVEETMDMMKNWYDGYSWDGKTFLYNPFSVLGKFQKINYLSPNSIN